MMVRSAGCIDSVKDLKMSFTVPHVLARPLDSENGNKTLLVMLQRKSRIEVVINWKK